MSSVLVLNNTRMLILVLNFIVRVSFQLLFLFASLSHLIVLMALYGVNNNQMGFWYTESISKNNKRYRTIENKFLMICKYFLKGMLSKENVCGYFALNRKVK